MSDKANLLNIKTGQSTGFGRDDIFFNPPKISEEKLSNIFDSKPNDSSDVTQETSDQFETNDNEQFTTGTVNITED